MQCGRHRFLITLRFGPVKYVAGICEAKILRFNLYAKSAKADVLELLSDTCCDSVTTLKLLRKMR